MSGKVPDDEEVTMMEESLTDLTAVETITDQINLDKATEVRVEGLEQLEGPMGAGRNDGGDDAASFVSCSNNRTVQVAVRVRPLNGKEKEACFETLFDKKTLTQHALDRRRRKHPTILRAVGTQTFCYDEVFPEDVGQKDVYEHRVAPLVQRCIEGYNATILAYGQTGSGKTYTMTGPPSNGKALSEDLVGVIPRAIKALFVGLEAKQKEQESRSGYKSLVKSSFKVRVQFLELYMEDVRDLLQDSKEGSTKVQIRAIGNQEPEVLGSVKATVASAEEALELLAQGVERRVTGVTSMNATSSRSHAIFSVMVEQTTSMTGAVSKGSHVKKSQFHLCDLAGSERHKRVFLDGQTEKQHKLMQGEVCQINMGLLALGNVISSLGDPKRASTNGFVPYRDSKLTLLLKGSLGGNHHTLMIACVSPSRENKDESVNTLRYANRAKNITNHVVVNVDRRSQLLDQLQSQVQCLANELLVAYEKDTTGGVAFRSLLQKIAAGEKDRQLDPEANTPSGETTSTPAAKPSVSAPSLSTTATGEPRPSRHVTMIPKFDTPSTPNPLAAKPVPEYLPSDATVEPEEVPTRLATCDEEIGHLREELREAKKELVIALAAERNPPDDGYLSDLSEHTFPSRIETIESFDSNDSVEIRGLRRKLCKRLGNLQQEDDEKQKEEYGNIMKKHYDKVKHMSLALQQKEETRADLVERMQAIEKSKEKADQPLVSTRHLSMPVVYASAAVYCSVLFCVSSIVFKFY